MAIQDGKTPRGIHFQHWVKGEPGRETLALVMGYSGSIASWSRDFLDDLHQSFDLLLLDNRGTGYSFHPAQIEEITVPTMADDLFDLASHLQLEPFHLLGYSLGGCIAQQFAASHPERIQSLLLLATTGGGSLYVAPGRDFLAQLESPRGETPWEMALSMWSLCTSQDVIQNKEAALRDIHDRQMQKPTPRRTFAGQMRAFKAFATENLFSNRQAPVPLTIISGKQDRLMPHGNSLKLQEYFQQSLLIEIDNCEHLPYLEQKQELLKAIQVGIQHK
jgi:pimeloyl-ACP methyl ester carboxylesterase